MALGKKVFVRKPYDKNLYKWSPQTGEVKKGVKQREQKFFCNATPRSQGEDFVTTYVYNQVNDNGTIRRFAYVACNYVK